MLVSVKCKTKTLLWGLQQITLNGAIDWVAFSLKASGGSYNYIQLIKILESKTNAPIYKNIHLYIRAWLPGTENFWYPEAMLLYIKEAFSI